ncbi:MAG: hypothetical protein QXO76_01225 [Thermoproteota archaeon]
MDKKYYHLSAHSAGDKVIYCTACGVELDSVTLLGDLPCIHPTAWCSVFNSRYYFEIQVWNFQASLQCFTHKDFTRVYYKIECDEDKSEKIAELTVKSVYEHGGALNISGVYPLSSELEKILEEGLLDGSIRILVPADVKALK